ncbi:MAG: polysaccharide deacetylase family protein [Cyclobacteriaceae bacterium]
MLYPTLLWDQKQAAGQKLYLSFDDGPVPEVTPFVLETLARFDAKATFFCVGENIERHPEVFRQLSRLGHRIGNHTYHHLNGWQHKNQPYLRDIARCQQVIEEQHTSQLPRLFRPPYGKISYRQIRQLSDKYQIVMWDILTGDFDQSFPAEKCLQKSLQHSRHGSILIFHDSYKAEKNLRYVLPRFMEHFAGKGYEFCSL